MDVVSSAIRSVEWSGGLLTVRFHETGTYDYFDVPEAVFRAFLEAPSKGAFFNDAIRDRYRFRRTGA